MKIRDLTNQRFGRLVVICKIKRRSNVGTVIWLCRCDCGNLKEVKSSDLVWGGTKSCGCLRKEQRINLKPTFKHGDAKAGKKTRLYRIWIGMKSRCLNPNDHSYKYYGEKGISVCKEWRNSYLVFKIWATANGYKEDLVIDRINYKEGYTPNNCQWITKSDNTRKGHLERKG